MNDRHYRTPTGEHSSITVSKTERGLDLIFARTREGELLVRLSEKQASDLATNIIAAIANEEAL